jgi:hypothetical protein
MLIHPWDAALNDAEWQEWLASHERWGPIALSTDTHSLIDPFEEARGSSSTSG